MRNVFRLLLLLLLCAVPSLAQTPRIELSAGPTFDRYTAPSGYYLDMAGWTFAGEYNVFRWLGGEFQASGDYSNKALIGHTSLYSVQLGPRFYPLHHHKLTPWGHFLFGEGYYREEIPANGGFRPQVDSDYSFAWRIGAGLDYNFKSRWGLRLLQFDYGHTRFFSNKVSQPDYRLSVGITYRFGTVGHEKKKSKATKKK